MSTKITKVTNRAFLQLFTGVKLLISGTLLLRRAIDVSNPESRKSNSSSVNILNFFEKLIKQCCTLVLVVIDLLFDQAYREKRSPK